MSMLCWILGRIQKNRKKNDNICHVIGVACMVDKVRGARLRWYTHVQQREDDYILANLRSKSSGTAKQRRTEEKMD